MLKALFESEETSDGVYLALVSIWDGVHAATTVPKLDLVSSPRRKIYIQVCLKRQWLDAVYLAVVSRNNLKLDVFESDCRLLRLLLAE